MSTVARNAKYRFLHCATTQCNSQCAGRTILTKQMPCIHICVGIVNAQTKHMEYNPIVKTQPDQCYIPQAPMIKRRGIICYHNLQYRDDSCTIADESQIKSIFQNNRQQITWFRRFNKRLSALILIFK